ncbi:MAG TPA: 5-(carboxyamino)imidazole ribonucleotide mutase [Bacillota bacterium]|jgi:5-(carboxyamino)imidazole ribonucleotide mutase
MPSGLVAVVLGSDSDLPKMKDCVTTLTEFGIGLRVTVCSAHRSPQRSAEFAANAAEEGYDVIIAAAGGAAHLAGTVAAWSTLPVIGVPLSGSPMGGVDALYSTVQMPPGVPVATVGIDAGRNAAILAVQILSLKYQSLRERLNNYKRKLAEGVAEKSARVENEAGQGGTVGGPVQSPGPSQPPQVSQPSLPSLPSLPGQPAHPKEEGPAQPGPAPAAVRRRSHRSGRRRKPNGQPPVPTV